MTRKRNLDWHQLSIVILLMPLTVRSLLFLRAHTLFLSSLLTVVTAFSASISFAQTPSQTETSASQNQVDEETLTKALVARMARVPEFRFIREEAAKLGIKAYLFGGTASGYAHYVRWDLLRERGDTRFQPERFDYDFTNIYRSNQDLDIVVDGPKEAIEILQKRLSEVYPHLQGARDAWEVRSLRENLGPTKLALLGNFDFLNQNSDSNSTGLIEITHSGDAPVRDLFAWDSPKSLYLSDVAEGRIRYYENPRHSETSLFKEGKNPSLLSVVRYLAKVTQFELEMRPEDLVKIRRIIRDFDPTVAMTPYAHKKLEQFGVKIIQNAVNMEHALNLIQEIGLKEKLVPLSDPKVIESLGWWFNKEPLRSSPLGQGKGKTARELGLTIVAHETNSFQAYESITRAHTGAPNVFISRLGEAGEKAQFGNGFYTKVGRNGAAGTGLTIRFELHPDAREGSDFSRDPKAPEYIIVHNKNALRVIQESLALGPVQFFELLHSLPSSERGILEKVSRRMKNLMNAPIAPEDQKKMRDIVLLSIRSHVPKNSGPLSEVEMRWLQFPFAANDLEIPRLIIERLKKSLESRECSDQQFVEALRAFRNAPAPIVRELVAAMPERIHSTKIPFLIAEYVLTESKWKSHPEILDQLLAKSDLMSKALVMKQTRWRDETTSIRQILDDPSFQKLGEKALETYGTESGVARETYRAFASLILNYYPHLLAKFRKVGGAATAIRLIVMIRIQPSMLQTHPQLIRELLLDPHPAVTAEKHVIFNSILDTNNPDKNSAALDLLEFYVASSSFIHKTELAELCVALNNWKSPRLAPIFRQLFKKALPSMASNFAPLMSLLQRPGWEAHPELVELMFRHATHEQIQSLKDDFFSKAWKSSPGIRAALNHLQNQGSWRGAQAATPMNIYKALQSGFHFPSSKATLACEAVLE